MKRQRVACSNLGNCFGKRFTDDFCAVLQTPYPPGKCPFQKQDRMITKGKTYPISAKYTGAVTEE